MCTLLAVVPNAETFGAYAESWLDYRVESGRFDPNTLAKDRYHARALSMVVGGMSMDSITPEVRRGALMRIKNGENATGRALSNTTLDGIYVAFKQIMQQAEDDGRVTRNPMRHVQSPRRDTQERDALSPGEIALFLNRVDEMLPLDGRTMALYLIACLGLRRAEACALMDADVHDGLAQVKLAVKESTGKLGRSWREAFHRHFITTRQKSRPENML